jgi:predicted dienelactone hydrolase
VDAVVGIADAADHTSSGSADAFTLESTYWIGRLPRDGRLRLTVAWPQAGLAAATTGLQLDDLGGLADRVVPLP